MKQFLDSLILWALRHYLGKTEPRVVAIVGSVGKTSTTQAIGTVLAEKYRVRVTRRNYNTVRGVVATVFGRDTASTTLGWIWFIKMVVLRAIFTKPNFDMLVLELGADKPGDIAEFAFLKPELAVVTAITPEHMEFFGTEENVAKEELSVASYASKLVVNADLVSNVYLATYVGNASIMRYGSGQNYTMQNGALRINGKLLSGQYHLVGKSGESTLCASATVADLLGLNEDEIIAGLQKVQAVPGRMNLLKGLNSSLIIDDTYNSSPEAVRSALDYLYAQNGKRIVLLGNMNEMGERSQELHELVGSWCDPGKLELVVTLGPDANTYLAAAAEKNGCKVYRAQTPKDAGEYILNMLSKDVIVLAKGSQNAVYAEEAVKLLLADPSDASKLVRQDTYWPKKKANYWVAL